MTAPTRETENQPPAPLPDPLQAHHREMLAVASAIDPDVIAERGYRTIIKKVEAKRLGFSVAQQDGISKDYPALVAPMRWPGQPSPFAVMRPDKPRTKGHKQDGKPKTVKYEMPSGVKMALDSPPRCHADLGNPAIPIAFTEGQKKSDSGASRGGCWISLIGVWNWRGTNTDGGKTMLAEWEDVALDGRKVYLVFDSDILEKIQVYNALSRLRDWLKQRGANVFVIYLPAMDDGSKCGVDDWYAADPTRTFSDLLKLASKDLIKPAIDIRREVYTMVADSLPGAPVSADIVVPLGYELGSGGVAKIEQDRRSEDSLAERRIPVALAPIYISSRSYEINTDEQQLTLCYEGATGNWCELTVGRDVVMDTKKLVGKSLDGIPVNSTNAKMLVEYLAAMEAANREQLTLSATSKALGWLGTNGDGGYLLGTRHVVPGGGEGYVAFGGTDGEQQIADAYHLRGTYDGWLAAISPVPLYPRVLLAMYAAFTAPILEIIGAPNCVLDLSYETSAGKTTTLRVAGSVFGNPNENDGDSLIKSWSSSRTYIERAAEMQPGLPLLLDETKRAKPDEIAAIVYDYANGQGKGRGTIKGIARSGSWRGVMLSTGEQPVTTIGSNEHGGVHARAIELWGYPLGGKDDSTMRVVTVLNRAICANYGHAGLRYVQYLVDHREAKAEEWRARYQQTLADYQQRVGSNAVAGRLCEYLAAIDTAARIVDEAGVLPWSYADPCDVLWPDIMSGASEADKATAARDYIMSWCASHQTHFWGRHRTDQDGVALPPHSGWAGIWDGGDDYAHIALRPAVLDKLLSERGYGQDVQRQWEDRGWLDSNGDKKNRVRRRLEGVLTYFVGLRRDALGITPDGKLEDTTKEAAHA